MGKFKRVCVYCGSNSGNRKIFSDAALDLGREMVLSLLLCFLSSLIIVHTKVQQWFFEIGNCRLRGGWISSMEEGVLG